MAVLTLGGVAFGGFEVPGNMVFGGAQQLAVHRLIGGQRVIDAMGRDDAAVRWSGVFSGGNAGGRARILDAMRAAGNQLSLAWDAFSYAVIIERLSLDFRNPWWIPYEISCTVMMDLAQNVPPYAPRVADGVLDDLTSAGAFIDVSAAVSAMSVPDALTPGNGNYAAATIALSNVGTALSQGIASAQVGLGSSDLGAIVAASGQLAQLCTAQGFVGRSVANLLGAGT
jgi:hypothetical protein